MINYLEDMLTNKVFSKQNLSKKFIFKFQDGALFEETGKGIPWLRIILMAIFVKLQFVE